MKCFRNFCAAVGPFQNFLKLFFREHRFPKRKARKRLLFQYDGVYVCFCLKRKRRTCKRGTSPHKRQGSSAKDDSLSNNFGYRDTTLQRMARFRGICSYNMEHFSLGKSDKRSVDNLFGNDVASNAFKNIVKFGCSILPFFDSMQSIQIRQTHSPNFYKRARRHTTQSQSIMILLE